MRSTFSAPFSSVQHLTCELTLAFRSGAQPPGGHTGAGADRAKQMCPRLTQPAPISRPWVRAPWARPPPPHLPQALPPTAQPRRKRPRAGPTPSSTRNEVQHSRTQRESAFKYGSSLGASALGDPGQNSGPLILNPSSCSAFPPHGCEHPKVSGTRLHPVKCGERFLRSRKKAVIDRLAGETGGDWLAADLRPPALAEGGTGQGSDQSCLAP